LVFVGTGDGRLVAFDAATGSVRWQAQVSDGGGAVHTSALLDGVLYLAAEGGGFLALDAATGAARWRFGEDAAVSGTVVVADGTAYVSGSLGPDRMLWAVDARTGTERWHVPEGFYVPAVSVGIAYSGSDHGVVAAHDATTGSELWRLTVDGVAKTPAIVGDTLFAPAELEHRLYALDAASGTELWHYDVDGAVSCCVAIARGMAFVATTLGSVYAIGGSESVSAGAALAPAASGAPVASASNPSQAVADMATAASLVWETTGSPEPFGMPSALEFDGEERLWLADSAQHRFHLLDRDGEVLETWGSSGAEPGQFSFSDPGGGPGGDVAFDADGNIYVADFGNRRVQVFDSDRRFVREWGSFGSGNGQFVNPYGIAVDADANVYVSDYGREDVQKFAPDGTWLLTFGGHGTEEGQLSYQAGVTAAPDGSIWVGDFGNGRVQQFSPDGTYLSMWTGDASSGRLMTPGAIAIDPEGDLYITDTESHRIVLRDANGGPSAVIEGRAGAPGQLSAPVGIALDAAGDIYVSNAENGRVQRFTRITN
jgi:outer membrane protein assembly factor BamB